MKLEPAVKKIKTRYFFVGVEQNNSVKGCSNNKSLPATLKLSKPFVSKSFLEICTNLVWDQGLHVEPHMIHKSMISCNY